MTKLDLDPNGVIDGGKCNRNREMYSDIEVGRQSPPSRRRNHRRRRRRSRITRERINEVWASPTDRARVNNKIGIPKSVITAPVIVMDFLSQMSVVHCRL